jgi:hypothetical protein
MTESPSDASRVAIGYPGHQDEGEILENRARGQTAEELPLGPEAEPAGSAVERLLGTLMASVPAPEHRVAYR